MPGLKPFPFLVPSLARCFVLSLLLFCVGPGLTGVGAQASEAGPSFTDEAITDEAVTGEAISEEAASQSAVIPQKIVITQKPLTLLVSELAGERATLVQVIPDGASPHEFSLSWSGRRQLADADLVVWGGAALEPQLASVMATLPAGKVFDASAAVTHWPRAVDCHEHGHEGAHAADGADHVDPGHESHDVGHNGSPACLDPHFWLNPRNMAAVAEALLERLLTLATVGEASLESVASLERLENSAQALLERIDTLDQQAEAMLAPLVDRFYVVEHDAYNHFSQHYGLRQPGFLRAGHGMPIGPRSFSALLARTDIGCVYTEPEYSPKLAQRLAAHTGATLQELDPLGSRVALAQGYSGFMARFVATFAGCFPVDAKAEEAAPGEAAPLKK